MESASVLNFALGETTDMLRDSIREFARAEIAPQASEIDSNNHFPRELWEKMGALGLLGITVEEAFGGAGMGYLQHTVAMEEISRASAAVAPMELTRIFVLTRSAVTGLTSRNKHTSQS